jgi:M6 family metalloprotease-like protein
VAVEFSSAKRGGGAATIAAIVPADRLQWPGLSKAVLMPKAVSGNTRWVTIACKFSDIAEEQKPVTFFNGQYGTSPGQLGHYWKEVSYNKINLTGSNAYGWFTLPQPRSFYVTMVDGEEDADLDKLFDDCTAAADPTVNFNGAQGINMMFNGDLDGFAWGGGRGATLDGQNKGWSTTWNPPWSFGNLAPLAHEMGHGYGLPHSNNSDGDDDPYDNPWDVMSDGWSNAVDNATYGSLPKHINVRQRDRLGWVDAARKLTVPVGGSVKEVVLDRASLAGSTNRQMIVLSLAAADAAGNVSYTVEARGRTGAYEAELAGDAVIIHGIDAGGVAYSMDADIPPADRSNNEGSMFKVGETWISPDGSQKVKVMSATANGFTVRIGNPRLTGGPLPPRTKPLAVVEPARAQPAGSGTTIRQRPGRSCGDSSSATSATRCSDRVE